MRADATDLDHLALKLAQNGIAAFCPTTLSCDPLTLHAVCEKLGTWITSAQKPSSRQSALPLGMHLEGPFINPAASGAHPPGVLRPATLRELDELWEVSRQTLKIITLAPEIHSPEFLKELAAWARPKKIILSLGHSCATREQAQAAFKLGFRNITHAWNALTFHHRNPGALGAAFGKKSVFMEIIPDQVHVDPCVINWTQTLHGHDRICFVSDCIPVAGLSDEELASRSVTFGPLPITRGFGAGRIREGENAGALAGGGYLLPQMVLHWLNRADVPSTLRKSSKWISRELKQAYVSPVKSLGLSPKLQREISRRGRLVWKLGGKKIGFRPLK